ncbi:hypothetical protein DSO57_1037403 [Entomophthora muscae]|uniref:Uncharacterized protein n=1 Tax=Entomophthora muscae TaxID=34485 RepID=A0ACC2SZ16_9FUNG|nr:hypothetical protein DSO57_1037403 [Entomophthora muscae]
MNMNISVFSLLVSGLFALEPASADAKPVRAEQPGMVYRGGGNYWNPYPGRGPGYPYGGGPGYPYITITSTGRRG